MSRTSLEGTLPSVGKGGFGEVEILWPLSGGELEGSYFGCRPGAGIAGAKTKSENWSAIQPIADVKKLLSKKMRSAHPVLVLTGVSRPSNFRYANMDFAWTRNMAETVDMNQSTYHTKSHTCPYHFGPLGFTKRRQPRL
jgi:hypothetical protein